MGSLAAEIFDEIIIRHDKDGRGRSNEVLTRLLTEGIRKVKPKMRVKIISDEMEAITYAIAQAKKDSWIFVNTDNVHETVPFVAQLHKEESAQRQDNTVAA
jgi:cyanophycin synthetase